MEKHWLLFQGKQRTPFFKGHPRFHAVFSPSSSKYTLGFRIDPEEKLRSVGKEIIQLLKAHSSQPELGVFEEIATKSDIPISFDEDVAVEKIV